VLQVRARIGPKRCSRLGQYAFARFISDDQVHHYCCRAVSKVPRSFNLIPGRLSAVSPEPKLCRARVHSHVVAARLGHRDGKFVLFRSARKMQSNRAAATAVCTCKPTSLLALDDQCVASLGYHERPDVDKTSRSSTSPSDDTRCQPWRWLSVGSCLIGSGLSRSLGSALGSGDREIGGI
jgi:hypothetical protein